MKTLEDIVKEYLDEYCTMQKNLDKKTIKAYRIDLKQFLLHIPSSTLPISEEMLIQYIDTMYTIYQRSTVKRKIASVRSFFQYLEDKKLIEISPFYKMNLPANQPKIESSQAIRQIIPETAMERLLSVLYQEKEKAQSDSQYTKIARDIAIVQLLANTGICISELCSLKQSDVDCVNKSIFIQGKGTRKRILRIEDESVMDAIMLYQHFSADELRHSEWLFINQRHNCITEQSVRKMLNRYAAMAGIKMHITPKMFRHSFAVSCLNANMDIRNVRNLLGHSSVLITEQYESILQCDNYID